MKKFLIIAVNIVILGGAIWLGYQKYQDYFNNPWTRDGQVRANVIKVAPRVSGPIVDVAVADNQPVKAGDLLFVIDPETYQVALSQAQVSLEKTIVSSRGKKIEYDRLKDIRAKDRGAVSHKDLIRREIAYEESLLQIKAAEEQLKSAKLNLSYTKVYASVDGFVSNLDIRTGTQAVANQPLLALIDSSSFWVFGFFRENQLANIHPGSEARVTLMSHPDTPIKARVDSIGWGIAPKDGTVGYNLLPNVNPVFQWIRLAQRIPVRITITELPQGVDLRFGLTASIMVIADNQSTQQ
ncbi:MULTISPECIES: HlyD family secretion protein [unclassified Vibrio]|uniref:HlyD family secretion protein n=1 Tax=unclassified Vibrio TaxID=2614977 RepID=UPI0013610043|nr:MULTISPECIES: HlyD family secretion protein [unclassified Vibrio]NAW58611.1 efflux RND transporter periplasmic adaptor subunit [Vibrio sp. V36_P2S2PM302]NAX27087.1 efflux RND transporter periplasmic adaptor subunit [Vibrio sp. V38_P2S17PM301]NAX32870.1 efflux RND transporter periplasmic adaptor subunit [Vibrio sp. V37_P2S8PM304]